MKRELARSVILLFTVWPTLLGEPGLATGQEATEKEQDRRNGEKKKAVVPLEIGDRAVDFALPGVDGKTYRLKDFARARILIVCFTCNHCPTAQAYEERIIRLVKDYRPKGVELVAISPNDPRAVRLDELGYTDLSDSLEEMKIRARDRKYNFPYLYDGDRQDVSRAYGARATPQLFIFDEERKLRYTGRIDSTESGKDIKSHDARRVLDALLAGEAVPVERTRAFGCSVKWSDKRAQARQSLKKWAAEKVTLDEIDARGAAALRKNKEKKLRLINVWATTCGPCRIEFPELVKMHRMYRHRGFELVTITIDLAERREEALAFLRKQQASGRNTIYGSEDRDALAEALAKEWSGTLPFTLLVGPGGRLLYRHEGQIDPLKVRRVIVKQLGRTYRR